MKNNISSWAGYASFVLLFTLAAYYLFNSLGEKTVQISVPIQIPFGTNYGVAIDKHNQLWQWQFDDKEEMTNIQKVAIDDVHSVVFQEAFNYAVDQQGVLWSWEKTNPSKVSKIKDIKSPVKKILATEQAIILLHTDGTLSVKGEEWQAINLTAFKDIKDLQNIKRLTGINLSAVEMLYAINEQDSLFYWGYAFQTAIPRKFPSRVNAITSNAMIDKKGNYELVKRFPQRTEKGLSDFELYKRTELPIPRNYGAWGIKSSPNKMIVLDTNGQLSIYKRVSRSKVVKVKSFNKFKVNLDYYKA